jgi:hypothetical protein
VLDAAGHVAHAWRLPCDICSHMGDGTGDEDVTLIG